MDFVERLSGNRFQFDPETLFKFSNLDPRVQKHLQKVYATLGCAVALSAAGALANIYFGIGGVLSFWVAFGSLLWLGFTEAKPSNLNLRYGLLGTFAFSQGSSIGPLIQLAVAVNPGIVVVALMGAGAVFASFSAAALMSPRRSYLYLGGLLSTAITSFMVMRLGGWMLGMSAMAFQVELYLGLIVFALYIIFDTQMIVEKASAGMTDHVRHALDLFVDLLAIFVRILIIMLKNADKKKQRERKEKK